MLEWEFGAEMLPESEFWFLNQLPSQVNALLPSWEVVFKQWFLYLCVVTLSFLLAAAKKGISQVFTWK